MSSERKLSRRSALHGTVAVTIAQILAACGSDSDGSPGAGGTGAGGAGGRGGLGRGGVACHPGTVEAGLGGSAGAVVAAGEGGAGGQGGFIEGSYGELIPRDGVISLPESFLYVSFAAAGTPMSDGLPMPGAHD